MPSFSRIGEFFGAYMDTGRCAVYVHLRFSSDHLGPPAIVLLALDTRFEDAPADLVAKTVESAVAEANDIFGSDFRVAEVQYRSDNDGLCRLVGRACYKIVQRLATDGPNSFREISS